MRRLVCFVIGHGPDVRHQDGKGAAWTNCSRCGIVTGSFSYHGGKPWLVKP